MTEWMSIKLVTSRFGINCDANFGLSTFTDSALRIMMKKSRDDAITMLFPQQIPTAINFVWLQEPDKSQQYIYRWDIGVFAEDAGDLRWADNFFRGKR